ncbi:MAG: hypothetical protein F6J93_26480 [Oscillatoria sp. SIO1A7]|nr:hypothetical protein [Oscillatoria sp. SIO1A7]
MGCGEKRWGEMGRDGERWGVSTSLSALNPTPYTRHPTPYTLDPKNLIEVRL